MRITDEHNTCSQCGASEIVFNIEKACLQCVYCKHEFLIEEEPPIKTTNESIQGRTLTAGAQDIEAIADDRITIECGSCGAEVVIDTQEASQTQCHWCRRTLSIQQQIPNGRIPDLVLPFKVTRAEAEAEIKKFVGERKIFAHPKFKKQFTLESIKGVYFPYMMIDVDAHAELSGHGEQTIRKYRDEKNERKVYYDVDRYEVARGFDLKINDLTIESREERLSDKADRTNNVVNAVLPFDTENCVKWNANYLKGYTAEGRDINADQLAERVSDQAKDIARYAANDTLKQYDRGVVWEHEQLVIQGEQWRAVYLPIWLYSYRQKRGDSQLLHYVAVNGRTKEISGSVPVFQPMRVGAAALTVLIGLLLVYLLHTLGIGAVVWVAGAVFIPMITAIIYLSIPQYYRNMSARHTHEKETVRRLTNLQAMDEFVHRIKGTQELKIKGRNNTNVSGVGMQKITEEEAAELAREYIKQMSRKG